MIVYVLVILASIITSLAHRSFSSMTAVGMLLASIVICIMVYDTHCLTSGNCGVWSWIRTGIYVIIPIIALIFWIGNIGDKKKADADTHGAAVRNH